MIDDLRRRELTALAAIEVGLIAAVSPFVVLWMRVRSPDDVAADDGPPAVTRPVADETAPRFRLDDPRPTVTPGLVPGRSPAFPIDR